MCFVFATLSVTLTSIQIGSQDNHDLIGQLELKQECHISYFIKLYQSQDFKEKKRTHVEFN